jgi:L-lysine 2,3-aminomutase
MRCNAKLGSSVVLTVCRMRCAVYAVHCVRRRADIVPEQGDAKLRDVADCTSVLCILHVLCDRR